MSRDWTLFLADIHESCSKIRRYVESMSAEEFQKDEKTFDAVVRNLEIIGEASKRLPAEVTSRIPDVDWRKVAGLRDVLAHAYFGIDEDVLWDVVSNKVPELARFVRQLLDRSG